MSNKDEGVVLVKQTREYKDKKKSKVKKSKDRKKAHKDKKNKTKDKKRKKSKSRGKPPSYAVDNITISVSPMKKSGQPGAPNMRLDPENQSPPHSPEKGPLVRRKKNVSGDPPKAFIEWERETGRPSPTPRQHRGEVPGVVVALPRSPPQLAQSSEPTYGKVGSVEPLPIAKSLPPSREPEARLRVEQRREREESSQKRLMQTIGGSPDANKEIRADVVPEAPAAIAPPVSMSPEAKAHPTTPSDVVPPQNAPVSETGVEPATPAPAPVKMPSAEATTAKLTPVVQRSPTQTNLNETAVSMGSAEGKTNSGRTVIPSPKKVESPENGKVSGQKAPSPAAGTGSPNPANQASPQAQKGPSPVIRKTSPHATSDAPLKKVDFMPVNVDEVLRLGSVLERHNISEEERAAFDWLAVNRGNQSSQPSLFSAYLNRAVGAVEMEKKLAIDSLHDLKRRGALDAEEVENIIGIVRTYQGPLTINNLALLLKTHGRYYQRPKV